MNFPHQDQVVNRLQNQALEELHDLTDKSWSGIERLWRKARTSLRGHILDVYHGHFRGGPWSLAGLHSSGAWFALNQGLRDVIDAFKHESWLLAKAGVNDIYKLSILRHAWVLDQTTPPNFKVRIPYKMRLIEAAAVAYYTGDEATRKFQQRWSAWSDAYYTALVSNLQLGAINESAPQDAADEVDATTVNTPKSSLIDALARAFEFNAMLSLNDGISAVAQTNELADVVQIWQTRSNLSVCDLCSDNEGLTEEESDGGIPAHPNCRCYWRLVPASWAKLLRSGDDIDYATAIEMDAQGLVPNAMAILGPDGRLAGHTIVDFKPWLKNNFHAITSQ